MIWLLSIYMSLPLKIETEMKAGLVESELKLIYRRLNH